jgi:DNA-binding CsgD family transcriptional regulator
MSSNCAPTAKLSEIKPQRVKPRRSCAMRDATVRMRQPATTTKAKQWSAIGRDIGAGRKVYPMSASENWSKLLSSREQEIALLVGRGLSNKDVARELGLSPGTVKVHVHNIFKKLGERSRHRIIATLLSPSVRRSLCLLWLFARELWDEQLSIYF